jgi:hypothetical protein
LNLHPRADPGGRGPRPPAGGCGPLGMHSKARGGSPDAGQRNYGSRYGEAKKTLKKRRKFDTV